MIETIKVKNSSQNSLQIYCVTAGSLMNNKAYRPNAHLLYILMHYNGNII